jgi:5-methylcytosine-specific restriction protein A
MGSAGHSRSVYRHWYWTQRWRRKAKAQLRAYPLCARCQEQGHITAATVADHVEPHRGDEQKFWNGALASLCKAHHSRTKQREEGLGYRVDVDEQGFPLDPAHPWNKRASA